MKKYKINKNNCYNLVFNGIFKNNGKDCLIKKFESNFDSYNLNLFLFKAEFPAMVSILKRIVLYYFSIIFLFFSYVISKTIFIDNFFFFILKFFLINNCLVIIILLFFYILNTLLVIIKPEVFDIINL